MTLSSTQFNIGKTTVSWNNIDCVLLDMDGTLLDLHFDNYFWLKYLPACYAEKQSMSYIEAKQYLHSLFSQHAGTLNWYCTDFWSDKLNLSIVKLKQQVAERIAPREGALDFLKALQQAGKRLILATNAHRDSLNLKMQRVPLNAYFERMISSHDYGYPKEDARFWATFSEDLALNPARCLLIDDSLAVLHSAQRFGIAHLLAVGQPDSQLPLKDTEEFATVHDWPTLLRGLGVKDDTPIQ